jgi:DNA modification methylase
VPSRRVVPRAGGAAASGGVPPSSVTLNHLYYGDNLDVLRRHIASESVDLVYLDPPFNSNRSYNVLFKEKSGTESHAQIEAFGDTWTWSYETEVLYQDLVANSSVRVADALEAMRKLLGDNDVLAYLVMMATRLVELHRVLRSTGSLYLHCDPTASHYLKILLDAIFRPRRFRNEIIWKRTAAHGGAHRFGPVHDVLLFYTKTDDYTWNQQYGVYSDAYIKHKFSKEDPDGRRFQDVLLTGPGVCKGDSGLSWREHNPTDGGRHWAIPSFLVTDGIVSATGTTQDRLDELDEKGRIYWTRTGNPRVKYYLEEAQGMPQQDVWTDIPPINSQAAERLGYPTQKPLVLLERLIASSSNKGDLMLDPFAGCGTAIDAAQKLGRRWSGIDITTLSVDLIDARLRHTYSESIRKEYDIVGIPKDLAGATELFAKSPFEFERWCVMLVDGQPNEKQVGDRGVDGVIRIPTNSKGGSERVLISVKGGASNPGHVRELIGTVESQRAAMGIFICLREPTRGMLEAAEHSGIYTYPVTNGAYPKVQILTVAELLDGNRPDMPTSLLPYFQAQRRLVPEQRRRPT